MALWLYLHFPTLQLDSLFCEDTQRATAVIDCRHHQVVQANSIAIAQGVKQGMGLGSAAALCQDLQLHPYDQQIELARLNELAQWLYLVTSDISLCPPNGLLVKVTNMLSLYDGIDNYWQTLQQHLTKMKVQFDYATGISPLSAMMMAKQAHNWIEQDPEALKKALLDYPLTCSELPAKQVEKLHRVGLHSIKDLIAIPLPDIAKRFDIDLVNYVGRLIGQFKHPVDFYHPPEQFRQYLELLFEIENIDWLQKPLARLFSQLETFLKLRDKVAFELSLTLHQRDHVSSNVHFYSAQGDYLATKWQELSKLTLENIQLNAPVNGLTLTIVRADQLTVNEHDLFAGEKGALTALELISKLQAKLGHQAVTSLQLTDDPRPEYATQPLAVDKMRPSDASAHLLKKLRPSLLYATPVPLQQPVYVQLGPERIVSGWWDDNPVKRDYYIARSSQGQWLWIFRTDDKQWFVHGQFS